MERQKPIACLAGAALGTAAVLIWQCLTVHYNYQGHWTALFYTGSYNAGPPSLAPENIYTFPDSIGYDGQFYHYIAHDPLLRTGIRAHVDNPRLRWRRILVPGLAFLLAAGRPESVDAGFFAVTAGFFFLGVYWCSRFCARCGISPGWGLCFGLIPGVLTSIDRMTIDIALVALCAGFALYGAAEPSRKVLLILALAPLARETGVSLILGYCLSLAIRKQWRPALHSVLAALPWLGWIIFVHQRTDPDLTVWGSAYPLVGIIGRTLQPVQFALTGRWLVAAATLDYIGLLGIWAALFLAVRLAAMAAKASFGPLEAAIVCSALPVLFAGKSDIWSGGYEFGRTMSPLLALLALEGIRSRWWWNLLPFCMTAPRILFQLEPQWKGVIRGMLRAL